MDRHDPSSLVDCLSIPVYTVLSVLTFNWWCWSFAWISSTSLYSFMFMKSTSSAYATSGGRNLYSGWRRTSRKALLDTQRKVPASIHLLEVCQCLLWSVVGLLHWFSCWSQYCIVETVSFSVHLHLQCHSVWVKVYCGLWCQMPHTCLHLDMSIESLRYTTFCC